MRLEPRRLGLVAGLILAAAAPRPCAAQEFVAECALRRAEVVRAWLAEPPAASAAVGSTPVLLLVGAPDPRSERIRQDENAYYLTGLEVADLAVLMAPAGAGASGHRESLFLAPHGAAAARWTGPRVAAGPDAQRETGFQRVVPRAELAQELRELSPDLAVLYYVDEPRLERGVAELRARTVARAAFGDRPVELVAVALPIHALRKRKSAAEVDCLRRAVLITAAGLDAAAAALRPGAFEYELQGALEGRFLAEGAEGAAFSSIVGSGPNSCIPHWMANQRRMLDGDLVVLDVGARYRGYCADVTRTLPVSGTFTPRQRALYDAVLAAADAGAAAAVPGATLQQIHEAAARSLSGALVRLGLLAGDPSEAYSTRAYARFFPHGTSHWLGLAVHDVGSGPLEPGAVFTIEPGLYVEAEGIGIRVEDDYFMTAEGTAERLTANVPRGASEIEAWLSGRRLASDGAADLDHR